MLKMYIFLRHIYKFAVCASLPALVEPCTMKEVLGDILPILL